MSANGGGFAEVIFSFCRSQMCGLCLRDARQRETKNQQQCSSVIPHSVWEREYSMPASPWRGQGDVRESHNKRHDADVLELGW